MSAGGIKIERGFSAMAKRGLGSTLIPAKPPRRLPRNWRPWMTVLCVVSGIAVLAGMAVWASSCQKKPAPAVPAPVEVLMHLTTTPAAAPVPSPTAPPPRSHPTRPGT